LHPKFGRRVHTPQGEGRLLRVAPFGTCGECGEVEGRYAPDADEFVCTNLGCALPLTDVIELAVVQIQDETVSVPPEALTAVDPQPYD